MPNRKNIPFVSLPNGIWKSINGFEGLYEVSNMQRVKSLQRKGINGRLINEKILRSGKHSYGYPKFIFCKDGRFYHFPLHRLMAIAFIPNPLNLPCVNHMDNNPENNSIENLEWCTWSHNSRWAYKSGNLDRSCEKNSMSKLTSLQAMEIFNSIDDSNTTAKKYNVTAQTVRDIKAGRRWYLVTGKRHKSVKKRICEQ